MRNCRHFTSARLRCCHLTNFPEAPIISEQHQKSVTIRFASEKAVPERHRVQRISQLVQAIKTFLPSNFTHKLSSTLKRFLSVLFNLYNVFILYSSSPRWSEVSFFVIVNLKRAFCCYYFQSFSF